MSMWQRQMIDRLRSLSAKIADYRRGMLPVIHPHEAEAVSLMADTLERRARIQRRGRGARTARSKARVA